MKSYKPGWETGFNILSLLFFAMIMSISIQGKAQSDNKDQLLQMIEEDRTTVDAIAGYDAKVQRNILQVVQTPEALDKIQELQKRSQNQFRVIINDYDRDAQTAFYDMARYPNLITDLVSNGRPSSSDVSRIVSNYPEDVHASTIKYARMYYDVLRRIDQLNSEIDNAFRLYLEPYGPQTRESVNTLLAYPEIVSTLAEDKDFTALLGEVYREDPNWVMGNLSKISQELADQNKEDLEAYKNQIQSDPEAYNEMLAAAEKYAKENNEARYESSVDPVVEVRVVNSYPYWFGYPYWYSDPYWRPRPFYYNTGFYRNRFGTIVFVGLPSYHFVHWQTYYHPTLYPHLSYNYYSYYENHYVNRYRDAHRPIPHNGFYRSIESNVVRNPRVNNSNLERIDRQRGNNIVRRPSSMESGSTRRGNSGITRQREYNTSRPGAVTNGAVNSRGNGSTNSSVNRQRSFERPAGAVNQRENNTVNPGRTEGSINRSGSGNGNGTIRRESAPANANPGVTPTERPQQRANQPSQNNNGNRATQGRSANQVERSAAPTRREAAPAQRSAAPDRSTRKAERREAKAASRQPERKRSER